MCGIAGFLESGKFNHYDMPSSLDKMRDALIHRGPDEKGSWVDQDMGIALAHRRLSVIDLSPAGSQPMISESGRYVLVFNGEIYNHLELREKLAGVSIGWKGHSDTETLLNGFEKWGLHSTLRQTVGMFALALWDRQEKVLYLSRDRLGEKPLYYGWQDSTFLFASEIGSLKAHPSFQSKINHSAVLPFLNHGYIPAPLSVWQGIYKLTPGCSLKLNFRDVQVGECPKEESYWSFQEIALAGLRDPLDLEYVEAKNLLHQTLSSSVKRQMVADVPLGAFLSGGIDSSLVVALMQSHSSNPIKTFTIGFNEKGFNEAEHAKAVAGHLGTDHTELYVDSKEAIDVIPNLPEIYTEPFADSSAIPTFIVSRLARSKVTVSLSGDGGDELFGGYGRYFSKRAEKIWNCRSICPPMTNLFARAFLNRTSTGIYDGIYRNITGILGVSNRRSLKESFLYIGTLLKSNDFQEFYLKSISQWTDSPVLGNRSKTKYGFEGEFLKLIDNSKLKKMAIDTVTYLPDDILAKVDRAAMAVSLETRVPMLDHAVVELAWKLKFAYKVDGNSGKAILKDLLYEYVPRNLIDRPKMGFGVPVGNWIKGPLRDWAEGLLSEKSLTSGGSFDAKKVRHVWESHLTGEHDSTYALWNILMWQAWLKKQNG